MEKGEPASVKELLKPIEENYQSNTEKYPISFTNFSLVIEMIKGQKDPVPTVQEFTGILQGIIHTLDENDKLLNTRMMKVRFTKLKRQLQNFITSEVQWDIEESCSYSESSDGDT